MDAFRVASVTRPVALDLFLEHRALVVRVERLFLETHVAVHHRGGHLDAELRLRAELAAHHRPDPRLVYADNAVLHRVFLLPQHLVLLAVQLPQHPAQVEGRDMLCGGGESLVRPLQARLDVVELPAEEIREDPHAFPALGAFHPLGLGHLEKHRAHLVAVVVRPLQPVRRVDRVDCRAGPLDGLVDQSAVRGIGDVGRRDRGVDHELAFVGLLRPVPSGFSVTARRLVLGPDYQLVYLAHLGGDPRTEIRHLGLVERRRGPELGEPQEILGVRVLADHLH